ncbi:hypothetical protein C8R46DRAFT_993344 [Mycena filopes]|nr:hypothetical protein C8R46DRAFT_993344 [Mycena filopes]
MEIVGEEVAYQGKMKYEVRWKNWTGKDGRSTTWEGPETISEKLPTEEWVKRSNAPTPATEVKLWGTLDIVNRRTREHRQGYTPPTAQELAAAGEESDAMMKRMEELKVENKELVESILRAGSSTSTQQLKPVPLPRRSQLPAQQVNAEAGPSRLPRAPLPKPIPRPSASMASSSPRRPPSNHTSTATTPASTTSIPAKPNPRSPQPVSSSSSASRPPLPTPAPSPKPLPRRRSPAAARPPPPLPSLRALPKQSAPSLPSHPTPPKPSAKKTNPTTPRPRPPSPAISIISICSSASSGIEFMGMNPGVEEVSSEARPRRGRSGSGKAIKREPNLKRKASSPPPTAAKVKRERGLPVPVVEVEAPPPLPLPRRPSGSGGPITAQLRTRDWSAAVSASASPSSGLSRRPRPSGSSTSPASSIKLSTSAAPALRSSNNKPTAPSAPATPAGPSRLPSGTQQRGFPPAIAASTSTLKRKVSVSSSISTTDGAPRTKRLRRDGVVDADADRDMVADSEEDGYYSLDDDCTCGVCDTCTRGRVQAPAIAVSGKGKGRAVSPVGSVSTTSSVRLRRLRTRTGTANAHEDEDDDEVAVCECGTLLPPPDMWRWTVCDTCHETQRVVRKREETREDARFRRPISPLHSSASTRAESLGGTTLRGSSTTSSVRYPPPPPLKTPSMSRPVPPANSVRAASVNTVSSTSSTVVSRRTRSGVLEDEKEKTQARIRISSRMTSGTLSKGKMREMPETKSLRLKIESQWSSIAQSDGAAGITFVNDVDEDEVPDSIREGKFVYLEDSYHPSPNLPFELNTKPDSATLLLPDHLEPCMAFCQCSTNCVFEDKECCQDREWLEKEGLTGFAYTNHLFNFTYSRDHVVVECGPFCLCPVTCGNRVAQRPRKFPIEIFKTPHCGWGVRTPVNIVKGMVLGVYTGKLMYVLHDNHNHSRLIGLFSPRAEAAKLKGKAKEYCFDLDYNSDPNSKEPQPKIGDLYTVDSYKYGNWTRFINHSCRPNLRVQPVVYDTLPQQNIAFLAFVATEDIPARKELTFDYSPAADSPMPRGATPCGCGVKECRGWVLTR